MGLFLSLDNEDRREVVTEALALPRQVPSDALKHGVLVYDCTGSVGCPSVPTTVTGFDGNPVSVPCQCFRPSQDQFRNSDPADSGVNPAMITYLNLFPAGNNLPQHLTEDLPSTR